ncbi:uncharacterized protein LOC130545349 [Triplophysa rosa]|uniref:uncharacterized protein LOC130545349 n=1 Tax=Triplophysa rosa TaxID=992332 RepID=UPI0025461AD6|nr:uncharacterized protein LOC130545349 [Triplophysa rosa]
MTTLAGSMAGSSPLPAGLTGPPRLSPIRQHDSGVLHKSPVRPLLKTLFLPGTLPLGMGSVQSALTKGNSCARQTEPGSRYAISEQRPFRGMDAPPRVGSENLGSLRQGRNRPFCLKRQHSLTNLLFEGQGCLGPQLAQPAPLCLPPDRSHTTDDQEDQRTGAQGAVRSPTLEEPALGCGTVSAARSSPVAYSPETGPPLSGRQHDLAPPTRAVGSAPLASRREPTVLPESVMNTISQARPPSTGRLYNLKWSVFSTWCTTRGADPESCDISLILSFLQELLDKGRSPSTLKVYVAAIAASHAPIAGQGVGKNDLVIRFLKGSRRLRPPRPLTVLIWDLPTVLRALKGPSFEPLQSADLRPLTLKTALLLALASVKCVGDLQALSVSPSCLEFGPDNSKVVLKPRHGYVPKVLSTPFRAQVVTLSVLPSSEQDPELNLSSQSA